MHKPLTRGTIHKLKEHLSKMSDDVYIYFGYIIKKQWKSQAGTFLQWLCLRKAAENVFPDKYKDFLISNDTRSWNKISLNYE